MKLKPTITSLSLMTLFLAVAPSALASTTWYVSGASGSDNNDCRTSQTACKTIGHAISLAASGDSIMVGAATYGERLTIGINVNVIGSGASTTIVDGGLAGSVVITSAYVTLSNLTITDGQSGGNFHAGGGIVNAGTLTINNCIITKNQALRGYGGTSYGGGIYNTGSLTINNSTISQNTAAGLSSGGGIYNRGGTLTLNKSTVSGNHAALGGGVSGGTVTINKSTISANTAGNGGGVYGGMVTIVNSTITGNTASQHGGGVNDYGTLAVFSSTFGGNSAVQGGGIFNNGGTTTVQNSIVANSPSSLW